MVELMFLLFVLKVLGLWILDCPDDRRLQEQYKREHGGAGPCVHTPLMSVLSIWATSGPAERSALPSTQGPAGALPVFLPTIDVLSRP